MSVQGNQSYIHKRITANIYQEVCVFPKYAYISAKEYNTKKEETLHMFEFGLTSKYHSYERMWKKVEKFSMMSC